jgi:hypothetical protein
VRGMGITLQCNKKTQVVGIKLISRRILGFHA